LRRQPHDVLLPTDDVSLSVCTRYRADFERMTRLPLPDTAQLAYGLDKARGHAGLSNEAQKQRHGCRPRARWLCVRANPHPFNRLLSMSR